MLYLILVSLPLLFGSRTPTSPSPLFTHNFSPIDQGLSYLGLVVGFFIAGIFQMQAQTIIYRFFTAKNGEGRPEYRLLPMMASMA